MRRPEAMVLAVAWALAAPKTAAAAYCDGVVYGEIDWYFNPSVNYVRPGTVVPMQICVLGLEWDPFPNALSPGCEYDIELTSTGADPLTTNGTTWTYLGVTSSFPDGEDCYFLDVAVPDPFDQGGGLNLTLTGANVTVSADLTVEAACAECTLTSSNPYIVGLDSDLVGLEVEVTGGSNPNVPVFQVPGSCAADVTWSSTGPVLVTDAAGQPTWFTSDTPMTGGPVAVVTDVLLPPDFSQQASRPATIGEVTVSASVESTVCDAISVPVLPAPQCPCSAELEPRVLAVGGVSPQGRFGVRNLDPFWNCDFQVDVGPAPAVGALISTDAHGVLGRLRPNQRKRKPFNYTVDPSTAANAESEAMEVTATGIGQTINGRLFPGGSCQATADTCLIPSDETAGFLGWGAAPKGAFQATLSKWSGTVEPMTASFETREVREDVSSFAWDDCYDNGIVIDPLQPCQRFVLNSNNLVSVGPANLWSSDIFGHQDVCVTTYRNLLVAPCVFGASQRMEMRCQLNGAPVLVYYTEGGMEYTIDTTQVTAYRMFSPTEVLVWP